MMSIIKKTMLLISLLLAADMLEAKDLRLPEVIGDNMVLQQNADACVWGWAAPGSTVCITASWTKNSVSVKADAAGFWKASLKTPGASFEAHTILVKSGSETVKLDNVLIGEVWLCSGQSNMEMPLGGYPNQPVEGQAEILRNSESYKYIRMVTIDKEIALSVQEECNGLWECSGLNTTYGWSATAFFFGKSLFESLNVPIGLINSSWGGSEIECWMSRENLISVGEDPVQIDNKANSNETWLTQRPGLMFNKMIWPLRHYTIAGFIWYQGCSNVGKALNQNYAEYMASMVKEWRSIFAAAQAPFYYVQLAPFSNTYGSDEDYAVLREYQRAAQYIIPNSGMAATSDLIYEYEKDCIHPRCKSEVGNRLALLALQEHYCIPNLQAFCPELVKLRLFPKDGKASVEFNRMLSGFSFECLPEEIQGFEACGSDGIWHSAKVEGAYDSTQLVISCPELNEISEVRYLWGSWFGPSKLWNSYHMPILPFNTAVTPCERQIY